MDHIKHMAHLPQHPFWQALIITSMIHMKTDKIIPPATTKKIPATFSASIAGEAEGLGDGRDRSGQRLLPHHLKTQETLHSINPHYNTRID